MRLSKRRAEKERLADLLVKAEQRLRALGNRPIWSSYDSGPALADFVAQAKAAIQGDVVDQATLDELWQIFAPTCDWDDSVDDVALGEAVFDSLERVYGRRVRGPAEREADTE